MGIGLGIELIHIAPKNHTPLSYPQSKSNIDRNRQKSQCRK